MGKRFRVPFQATAPGLVTSRHTHIIDAANHPIWQEPKEGCYTPAAEAAGDTAAADEGGEAHSAEGDNESGRDEADRDAQ